MALPYVFFGHVAAEGMTETLRRIREFTAEFESPHIVARTEATVMAAIAAGHMYGGTDEDGKIIFLTGCYDRGKPTWLEVGTVLAAKSFRGSGIQRVTCPYLLVHEWLYDSTRSPIAAIVDRKATASLENFARLKFAESDETFRLLRERSPEVNWLPIQNGGKVLMAATLIGLAEAFEFVAKHIGGVTLQKRGGAQYRLIPKFRYLDDETVVADLLETAERLRAVERKDPAE
jgi:hypothetical protein